MTWFWGVQWTSTSTGWAICVGFGQVGFALWAQLPPPAPDPKPALDLSDEQLAEFVSHKWDDVDFPRERP